MMMVCDGYIPITKQKMNKLSLMNKYENEACLIKTSTKKRKEENIVYEGMLASLYHQMPTTFTFSLFIFYNSYRCRIGSLALRLRGKRKRKENHDLVWFRMDTNLIFRFWRYL